MWVRGLASGYGLGLFLKDEQHLLTGNFTALSGQTVKKLKERFFVLAHLDYGRRVLLDFGNHCDGGLVVPP